MKYVKHVSKQEQHAQSNRRYEAMSEGNSMIMRCPRNTFPSLRSKLRAVANQGDTCDTARR